MTETELGDKKEKYHFFDYCVEFGYFKPDCIDDLNNILLHWDEYGNAYIEFCKENGYDSENLDEL